jgi:peptidoglycan/LPS O-acetylase OafA/YrhL
MLAITYGEYNNVLLPLSFLFGLSFMIFTISISIYPLRIFVNRFWCLMGKVSFSMYLLHLLVLEKISSKIVPTINSPIIYYIVLLITTTIITMAISYITYKIIEQPFQKLGKNIITKIEKVKY